MAKPEEVNYRTPAIKQQMQNLNITNLKFVVVNNPQPDLDFEDLPKPDFTGVDLNVPPLTTLKSVEGITIPDFKVMYNVYGQGQHNFPLDNFSPEMTIVDTSDLSKGSSAIQMTTENNLTSAYVNRFNVGLTGWTKTTYDYSDGKKIVFEDDYETESTSMTWDDIPLTTVFVVNGDAVDDVPKMTFETSDNTAIIIYSPLIMRNRFNLAANQENDTLYKFVHYKLAPGEIITTKQFPEAKYALMQICAGTAEIGGYHLDAQNFYEFDATQPLSVTAGPTGAVAVASIKVSSLGL